MLPTAPSPEPDQDILPVPALVEVQTRALFNSIPVSLITTLALDIILSASHWEIVGHGELIMWNLLMFGAICLRVICWYAWRNGNSNSVFWLNIFRGGVWLSAAAWGSSAFFMFANYNPSYQALLAFTLAGISSGSLTTLAIDKKSAMGFVILVVSPFTLRLFMENGPIAVPMAIMSIFYILFVLLASTRAYRNLEDQHEKNTQLLTWGKERIKHQKLSNSISQAQAQFIKDRDINTIFEILLKDILVLTDSKIGFIGEVSYNSENQPELNLHTISSLCEDKQLAIYQQQNTAQNTPLTNMNTLFGAAILKGKPVISNDPSKDIRGGGLPHGHPPLTAFLGIPLFDGTQPVALLGIANNPKGYDENVVAFLKPLTSTVNQFLEAIKTSQQQQAYEEKLLINARYTQAILDEVFDAIITFDAAGNIKSFNHAAETIFGYRAEEILNESINYLIPNSHAASVKPTQHKQENSSHSTTHLSTLENGQEFVGVRRSGKKFPIELTTSEMLMDNNSITIGVVRDISERKHNDELKNQFITTVSHALHTPLASIAGALDALNSESLGKHTEQQQTLLTIALHNSLHMQCLISDLVDMDKLLANKMELHISSHCILELVSKAIEHHQSYAEQHHVKLILTNSPKKTVILGDAQRIQQVLAHLILNAAKFSNPNNKASSDSLNAKNNTIDIGISLRGKVTRVSVRDYGVGIADEYKSKLFHYFLAADNADTSQKNGSGLGLALSKELMQRMGGNIDFTSTIGEGSCFYIELPSAD